MANRQVDYNFVPLAGTSIVEPEPLTDFTRLDSDYSIFVGVVGRITPKHPCANRPFFQRETGQCLLHHKVKKILATLA